MATNWNDLQALLNARNAMLAGQSIDSAPGETTTLGVQSEIKVTTVVPSWRVEGVAPVEVDAVSGAAPIEDPAPPVWPSKPRPETYAKVYDDLDPVLDLQFIIDNGLVELDPGSGSYEEDPGSVAIVEE